MITKLNIHDYQIKNYLERLRKIPTLKMTEKKAFLSDNYENKVGAKMFVHYCHPNIYTVFISAEKFDDKISHESISFL